MPDESKEWIFSLCLRCGYASHRERGERFCIHCGIELVTECPQCGNPIVHPWGEHCPFCGRRHTTPTLAVPEEAGASQTGGLP